MASSGSSRSPATRTRTAHRHLSDGSRSCKDVEDFHCSSCSSATRTFAGDGKSLDSPPSYQQSSGLILCGICKKRFHYSRPEALLAHLNAHFDMRYDCHRCQRCQINFVHEADLRSHLTSATLKKKCGYMFEHKQACSGHHPPRQKVIDADSKLEHRSRYSLMRNNDDARFDFCYRLKNWEELQLRAYYQRPTPSVVDPAPPKWRKTSAWLKVLSWWKAACLVPRSQSSSSLTSTALLTDKSVRSDDASKDTIVANVDVLGAMLLRAICTGDYNIAAALVHAGANTHLQDSLGYGAVHYAARYAQVDVLRLLARTGVYLDKPDDEGTTPLAHAVKIGRSDVVSCFLELGARQNFDFVRRSVVNGDSNTAEVLLSQWVKSCREYRSLDDLLLTAAWNRDRLMCGLLLAYGAKPSASDEAGNTAASIASALGYREPVRLLFDHGAELEWWEDDFKEYRHVAMVEKMLSRQCGDPRCALF